MDETIRTIRMFISSPGDVAEERDRARQVVESLRRRYSRRFILKPVLWEDLPLQADKSFQQGIDIVISKDQGIDLVLSSDRGIDIAIFILWSRLGSPVGPLIKTAEGRDYRSGTERELDLMLSARRQKEGGRPALLVYTRRDEASFEEQLRGKPTAEKEEMVAQKKSVESFIQQTFSDPEQHNTRAFHAYVQPIDFTNRLRVHLKELLDEMAGDMHEAIWDVDKQGAPFRGLESFQPEHAEVFFGREEETLEARFALREQAKHGCAFLLLTGASGSGKSSLARAGLLPEIVQNEIDESVVGWRSLILTPDELASRESTPDPLFALAKRLAVKEVLPDLRNDVASLESLARGFRENPQLTFDLIVRPAFEQLKANQSGRVRLLMIIDQAEEMFAAHVMTAADHEAFLRVIEIFARSGWIWVLATARSDFYHQIQEEPVLVRMLAGRGPVPVVPPRPDALQRLIEEPARLAGVRFEERDGVSLASRILRDAAAHAELLPLVEFVLRELFESRRADGILTYDTYEKLGGVEGAVGKKAEEAFLSLNPAAQAALNEILPLLVTVEVSGDQSAVRRRARVEDGQATPARCALTETLIKERFLTTDRQDNVPIVSLAHEALLRRWNRITNWITANREQLRMRARVEQSQQRWELQGRDPSLLLTPGLPLEEGRQLLATTSGLVLDATAEYIRRSIAEEASTKLRQRRRRRLSMSAMGILTVLALAASVVGYFQRRAAEDARQSAEASRQEAIKNSNAAIESQRNLTLQVYDNSIALAEREIGQNHDLEKATRLLEGDSCPAELRGWEWRYLMRKRDGDQMTLAGADGHKEGLWGATFSPDGKTIATCAVDGTLKFWDALSGECRKTIHADKVEGVTGLFLGERRLPIMCLEFSPDGKQIATGSFTPRVKTQFSLTRLPTLDRFSPGIVRIWNVETGEKVSEFQELTGVVLGLTFSPDGTRVATSSINDDNSFVVWDTKQSTVIKKVKGHDSHVHFLRYHPDGKTLATCDTGGYIKLWDAQTFTPLKTIRAHDAPIMAVSFAGKDSDHFASCGQDGFIRVWDRNSGERLLEMKGHMGSVLDAQYSPDGKRIASAGFDKTVRLWDTATGLEKITLRGHKEMIWRLGFSRDGHKLVSASFDKTARVWDATPLEVDKLKTDLTIAGHTDRVNGIAISSDGAELASASWDRTVRVWNTVDGSQLLSLKGHDGPVWGVSISADNKKIVSAGWDHKAIVWDRTAGKMMTKFTGHTAPLFSAVSSPDGELVASCGFDGQLYVWNAATGKIVTHCEGFVFPVYGVAFSPDGKRVLSGGSDRELKIWDAKNGTVQKTLKAHGASIVAVVFSPNGKLVAAASWDHTVSIWDLEKENSKPTTMLKGHDDRVTCVAFSPDSTRLATSSEDKTLRIWDATTGEEIRKPLRHRSVLMSVAFANDGKRVFAGSWADGAWIQCWKID